MAGMSYDHMMGSEQNMGNSAMQKGLPTSIDDMEDLQEYLNSGKAPTPAEEKQEDSVMQKKTNKSKKGRK